MNSISSNASARFLIALTLVAAYLFLALLPAFATAATYAYVNQSGEVRMVTADTPTIAIATAPNIHVHSGVLLLDSAADNEVIGDSVSGI